MMRLYRRIGWPVVGRIKGCLVMTALCTCIALYSCLAVCCISFKGEDCQRKRSLSLASTIIPDYSAQIKHPNTDGELTVVKPNMTQRLSYLNHACDRYKDLITLGEKAYRSGVHRVVSFPNIGIAYCKVPKAGCTFLTQIFEILDSDTANATSLFRLPRVMLHFLNRRGHKRTHDVNIPTIIAARDPFTRLYSAYVDKLFLQLVFRGVKSTKKFSEYSMVPKCGETVSFERFLQYIINRTKSGSVLDSHWTPVASLCTPCQRNTYFVVKQESFNDDIETMLSSLNVYKYVSLATDQKIKAAMTTERIESTIPGIIETVMYFYRNGIRAYSCMSEIFQLHLLWQSFQIQGFISSDAAFPEHSFNASTESNDMRIINQVFVDAAKASNMTKSDSMLQRRKYLIEAYKGVSKTTLDGIIKVFRADFLLFNYRAVIPQ